MYYILNIFIKMYIYLLWVCSFIKMVISVCLWVIDLLEGLNVIVYGIFIVIFIVIFMVGW